MPQRALLGGSLHDFLPWIRLRAIGDRIDVQLDYFGRCEPSRVGGVS